MANLRPHQSQFDHENGSISVLAAVCLAAIFGFLALAVDIGALRFAKQRLQMAADAAAIAGLLEIPQCATANCPVMQAAVQNALAENGYTGSTLLANCATGSASALTVTINNGPCALGTANPDNANTRFVEIVVSKSSNTYFANVVGIPSTRIQARSEAAFLSTPCLYTLTSNGTDINIGNNSAVLSVPNCGVIIDSDAGHALNASGSTTGASSIGIVGGIAGNGAVSPTPTTGITPVGDPLATLTAPVFVAAACLPDPQVQAGTQTLGPVLAGGTVCYNGLTVNNTGSVILNPGVYVINGTLNMNGSGSLSGTGVTLYIPTSHGNYNDSGLQKITLSAPLSGTYNGILIYQDPLNNHTINFNASATSSFEGILYAPSAQVNVNNATACPNLFLSLVIGSLNINVSLALKDYSTINAKTPLPGGTAVVSQ